MTYRLLARGIVVPSITVFHDNSSQSVDLVRTAAHLEWLIAEGANGIVIGGSSGEFVALAPEEIRNLIILATSAVRGRVPLYAATGRYSTHETIDLSLFAQRQGADGIMVVCPYYLRPGPAEVMAHFHAVREAVGPDFPIILYNNPGTCGYELPRENILRLHRRGIINAVKSSQGSATEAVELAAIPYGPISYYGHDYDGPAKLAHGWLTGILNVYPVRGDVAMAKIQRLADYVWKEGRMHPITAYKAALTLRGRDVGIPRRPLLPPTAAEVQALERILAGHE